MQTSSPNNDAMEYKGTVHSIDGCIHSSVASLIIILCNSIFMHIGRSDTEIMGINNYALVSKID